jgi:thiamine-monophosphate kinase
MTLREIGEFGFIRRISRGCLIRPERVIKAIGDDAAAFTTDPGQIALITTDLLVERIHFLRKEVSGFDLGYKSLAVNLSDIAAMGGTPLESFVSIAIPEDCSLGYLEAIYDGMRDLAGKFLVNILGGDTTTSKTDLIINVVVYGMVAEEQMLCRDAAKPGDIVFSTGYLGDSKAGLHLILHGIAADSADLRKLLRAHLLPEPHVAEGRFLAEHPAVKAAIDTSDGLSSDLGHITEESSVGATLFANALPISDSLKAFCERFDFDPFEYALSGGEDYTLLCTVRPDDASEIARSFQCRFDRPLFRIGVISEGSGMEIVFPDESCKSILPTGWDHFRDAK